MRQFRTRTGVILTLLDGEGEKNLDKDSLAYLKRKSLKVLKGSNDQRTVPAPSLWSRMKKMIED